jgi:hypothetical protein
LTGTSSLFYYFIKVDIRDLNIEKGEFFKKEYRLGFIRTSHRFVIVVKEPVFLCGLRLI